MVFPSTIRVPEGFPDISIPLRAVGITADVPILDYMSMMGKFSGFGDGVAKISRYSVKSLIDMLCGSEIGKVE